MALSHFQPPRDLLAVIFERVAVLRDGGQVRGGFDLATRLAGRFIAIACMAFGGRRVALCGRLRLHRRHALDQRRDRRGDAQQVGAGFQRHFLHGLAMEIRRTRGQCLADARLELGKALDVHVIDGGQRERLDGLPCGPLDQSQQVAQIKIVDFGIAKMVKDDGATPTNDGLTRVGALIGTPAYMSPEQAMASRVDARCDVYALGCVMYFALTGNPPFTSNNVMDLLYKHVHSAPPEFDPALKIPNAMKSIVLKCLEKKPEDRYQSMTQVCTDLKKLTKGVAVERKLLAKDRKLIYGLVKMCAIFFAAYLLSVFGNLAIQNLNDTVKKDSVAKVGTNKSLTGSSKGASGSGTTGSANKSQRRRQR